MNQPFPASPAAAAVRIIPRAEHNVSRSALSNNALRVLYRLRDAGFQAFLVGGGVRDVMLGRHPKDFDVATNALPDEIRSLFRNSRLVGRRFRLAHVIFGREVIEVATFRAASAPSPSEEGEILEDSAADDPDEAAESAEATESDEAAEPAEAAEAAEAAEPAESAEAADAPDGAEAGRSRGAVGPAEPTDGPGAPGADRSRRGGVDHERVLDVHGRLLRDNVYGTLEEDVWRRDFTVNALYYNIADYSLWDFVGGAEDMAARRLRLIGDPETRYREDPVRMLRAARFEAKLGFEMDPATAAPIGALRHLLRGVPPARLFDEAQKLFLTGHGERSLDALRRHGLFGELFPAVERYLASHPGGSVEQLLRRGLANTDARVHAERPVAPTFLFALLLYGPIAEQIESLPPQRWHELSAIMEACEHSLREASGRVSIPRRIALGVREMYALQPRLEQPRGRRALRLLEQPRFRAAFDLLTLRAQLQLASAGSASWWAEVQQLSPQERLARAQALPAPPRVRGAADATESAAAEAEPPGEGLGTAQAEPTRSRRPRRRRRRRRSGPAA